MKDFNLTDDFELDLGAFDCADLDMGDLFDGAEVASVENRYCLPKRYRQIPERMVKYEHAEAARNSGRGIYSGAYMVRTPQRGRSAFQRRVARYKPKGGLSYKSAPNWTPF